ncbi:MAG: GGDEF domain-containing protein [Candidatus Sungbacteria bacterium]|nr:GGDEF domain-containing protein [Candidatus Sungbacteria bacterium]
MDENEGGKKFEAAELSAEEKIAMLTEQLAETRRALAGEKIKLQELQQKYEAMEKVAMRDPLTGLWNRRGGMIEIGHILGERRSGIEEERRQKKRDMAVLALDIDHFGAFNNMYGHDAGDAVLQEVAQRLEGSLRKDDRVIRMGGEEITVVLVGVDDEGAYNFLFKKFGNDKREFQSGDHPLIVFPVEVKDKDGKEITVQVTFSGGIANWKEGASFEETQKIADELLYKAKEGGRNRILKAEPEDASKTASFSKHKNAA